MSKKAGRNQSEDGRMKFSEDILKQFDLEREEEKEPVNVMRISEMLDFMKLCAERIHHKTVYGVQRR